jgi:hypothetical protein
LLARLRRRLTAVTWLFALLLLAKAGVAMACAADGLAQHESEISASLVEAPQLSDANVNPADADSCWHEGGGGCHCACAHAAPMNGSRVSIAPVATATVEFPATHAPAVFARREPALRPPIA